MVFRMALPRVDLLPAARMPEDACERSADEAADASYHNVNACIQVAPPIAFAASRASDAVSDTDSECDSHPQADHRVTQASFSSFHRNAHDLRPFEGHWPACLL